MAAPLSSLARMSHETLRSKTSFGAAPRRRGCVRITACLDLNGSIGTASPRMVSSANGDANPPLYAIDFDSAEKVLQKTRFLEPPERWCRPHGFVVLWCSFCCFVARGHQIATSRRPVKVESASNPIQLNRVFIRDARVGCGCWWRPRGPAGIAPRSGQSESRFLGGLFKIRHAGTRRYTEISKRRIVWPKRKSRRIR